MAYFVTIRGLIWADIIASYAMWVTMQYLTNVWKLNFTRAAAILNIWKGMVSIMPVGLAFLVDTLMGNHAMLLLSSIAYTIGLGFLAMSTPPVLSKSTGTCSAYQPECIGYTQKFLFYAALVLVAFGISGHVVSLKAFLGEQTNGDMKDQGRKKIRKIAATYGWLLVPHTGGIALQYRKSWLIHFGIPAICTLVATLLFLSGSCSYKSKGPQGSPLTTVARVFVASAFKISHPCPKNASELYERHDLGLPLIPHTQGLRCFDKAAIILPNQTKEEQEKHRWRLCRVTEVEETKMVIRMIPMWMTFIIFGVVISVGNTYFIEQANHMNRRVGRLKVPLQIFYVFYESAKSAAASLYRKPPKFIVESGQRRRTPSTGISVAMIISVLCCITAARVETQRLNVIRSNGLLDKPGKKIPMSMFWMLPQFLLLGALDGISQCSIYDFFKDQAPPSMSSYLEFFTKGVFGLGIMASVLLVYIVGKVSEGGGSTNWFQDTLNRSRLDNYYWTLAALSAVYLVVCHFVAMCYTYRKLESAPEDQETLEREEPIIL